MNPLVVFSALLLVVETAAAPIQRSQSVTSRERLRSAALISATEVTEGRPKREPAVPLRKTTECFKRWSMAYDSKFRKILAAVNELVSELSNIPADSLVGSTGFVSFGEVDKWTEFYFQGDQGLVTGLVDCWTIDNTSHNFAVPVLPQTGTYKPVGEQTGIYKPVGELYLRRVIDNRNVYNKVKVLNLMNNFMALEVSRRVVNYPRFLDDVEWLQSEDSVLFLV